MTTKLPEAVRRLSDELAELPGIGPRQAVRLAFHIISLGKNQIKNLSQAVDGLAKLNICERCFFPTSDESGPRPHKGVGVVSSDQTLCNICKDKNRRQDIIMIVEKETDLISLENTGKFSGRYLVLGAMPKTGMLEEWQKLRLQNLKSFIEKNFKGKAEEIILAFNPTSSGDFHASLLSKELLPFAKKISRLGRGLPTGGEVEFADDETLGSALEKRS